MAVLVQLALASAPVAAQQEPPDIRTPLGDGAAGSIRTWQNDVNPERAPLTARPPLRLGDRNLIPTAPRRSGLTPRIGVFQDYDDNLYFSSGKEVDDFVTSVAPGLHYSYAEPMWRLDLDYSLEATKYWDETRLDDAAEEQSGLALFEARPSDRLSLRLLNLASVFEDPVNQDIPGLQPRRSSVVQNVMDAEALYALSPRERLRLGYGHVLSEVEAPSTDSMANDFEVGYARRPAPFRELGVGYRFRDFTFDGQPDSATHTVSATYDENLTKRVMVGAEVGLSAVTGALNRVDPVGSARLVFGGPEATLTAEYNRAILSSAGIGAPVLADSLTGRAEFRLGGGFFATGQIEYTEAKLLTADANDVEVSIWRPAIWFTYAASRDVTLYLSLSHVWQDIGDTDTSASSNRVTMGLTKTF